VRNVELRSAEWTHEFHEFSRIVRVTAAWGWAAPFGSCWNWFFDYAYGPGELAEPVPPDSTLRHRPSLDLNLGANTVLLLMETLQTFNPSRPNINYHCVHASLIK
jgi:hypothetical protein